MASRILTEFDCASPAVRDTVDPHAFKHRILVEGDSWMDSSTVLDPSLLPYLAKLSDKAKQCVLFINLARFGGTMANMGSPGEFGKRQNPTLITRWIEIPEWSGVSKSTGA